MGDESDCGDVVNGPEKFTTDGDVIAVICSDGEFNCSKSALTGASDYVRGLLDGSFMERNHRHVNLAHISRNQLQKVIALGESKPTTRLHHIVKNLEEAWELTEIADMLGFAAGSSALDRYICSKITPFNLDETYALADTYSRETILKSTAREMALRRSAKNVQECSSFNFVKRNKVYRKQHSEILEVQEVDTPCKSLANCSTIPAMAHFSFTHKFYHIGGYALRPITDCHVVECDDLVKFVECWAESDIFAGNVSSGSDSDDLPSDSQGLIQPEKYVANFQPIATFPDHVIEDYTIASVGTNIYIMGGFYYDKLLPSGATWRYDTRTDEWIKVSEMKHKRMMHCTAVVDERIYVCGGYDGVLVHNSTEKYDTNKDVWIEEPKMPIGVGNAACASLRESVYVVCGQFGTTSIKTTSQVQQYNTTARQWSLPTEYVSPVFHPLSEYGMSCGTIEDVLYVVGGQTVRVDCYNVKTGEWKRLSNMLNRRVGTHVTVYRGRLLAAGGYDYDRGTFFNTVEAYDKENDTWSILSARLSEHSRNAGLCYVFDVTR